MSPPQLSHHMLATGVHMKTRVLPAGGEPPTLLDAPFVFSEQDLVPLDPPLRRAKGNQIEVTCDYENPGSLLTFGPSSWDNEMCISIAYRYPAAASFTCLAVPPAP